MYAQKNLIETLRALNCSQRCFAAISGVNTCSLSEFLRGYANLSPLARRRIDEGLRDTVQLAQESTVPIDFRRVPEIREAIARMKARDAVAAVAQ